MKKTGEILRAARESKGLSLNEIALSLKINSKILSAIEEGDTAKLPGKAFLRGFVQSYSNYLRLNSEDVMRIYTEEMGPVRPTSLESPITMKSSEPTPEPASTEAPVVERAATEPVMISTPPRSTKVQKPDGFAHMEERSNARAFLASVVVLVVIGLIFVTKKVIDRYQRESVPTEVSVSSPLPNPETGTGPANAPATAAGNGSAGSVVANSASTAPVATGPASTGPTATTPALNPAPAPASPAPAPSKVAEKPAEPKEKPAETKKDEPAKSEAKVTDNKATETKPAENKPADAKPADTKTADAGAPEAPKKKKGKPLELIIEALDTVEVEYSTANGPMQKVTLAPETVHTIRSQNGIKVSISNGGAASLTLNGKDLGTAGDLGQAVKLSY